MQALSSSDETLDRLVKMTHRTNLVALDKVMFAIRQTEGNVNLAATAARCSAISERINMAAYEVGLCLPPNKRAV